MSRLFTPRHLAPIVLAIVVAALFTRLGVWQLDRRAEVRAANEVTAERVAQPPVDVGDLPARPDATEQSQLAHRRVTVVGTYDVAEEVLVRSRARNAVNGWHVVTPLRDDDGWVILVNRGWVPFEQGTAPVTTASTPDGEVSVTGYLLATEATTGFGPKDAPTGRLATVFRVDVERLAQQIEGDVHPMFVLLESQVPAQDGPLPDPARLPEFDEGNHLSYALQWFSFALLGLVTTGLFTRKRLSEPRPTVPEPSHP